MSNLVPVEDIERIVGAKRHAVNHLARAVSAEETVYILHSGQCLGLGHDLRFCDYSRALDKGILLVEWEATPGVHLFDVPVLVAINNGGRLVPVRAWPATPDNAEPQP